MFKKQEKNINLENIQKMYSLKILKYCKNGEFKKIIIGTL